MSHQASTYVWEHSAQKGTFLLLLLAIANYADRRGRAFVGVKRLAKDIRMSERNTQRALKRLVQSAELIVMPGAGPNGTNLWIIPIKENLPLFAVDGGDDKLSPDKLTGDNWTPGGVTNPAPGGDTAMPPEQKQPKATVKKKATPLPVDFKISDAVRTWARDAGFEAYLDRHLAHFIDYAKAKDAAYTDWDAAFRNCIRADWGGIRRNALAGKGPPPATHADAMACGNDCGRTLGPGVGWTQSEKGRVCSPCFRAYSDSRGTWPTRKPQPPEARA